MEDYVYLRQAMSFKNSNNKQNEKEYQQPRESCSEFILLEISQQLKIKIKIFEKFISPMSHNLYCVFA